jgi:serine/threonine protein kinase
MVFVNNFYNTTVFDYLTEHPDQTIQIMKQIISTFIFLHQNDILHLDIKHESFFIENQQLKVQVFHQHKTHHRKNAHFKAPEIYQQKFRKENDVFGLGVLFGELLRLKKAEKVEKFLGFGKLKKMINKMVSK